MCYQTEWNIHLKVYYLLSFQTADVVEVENSHEVIQPEYPLLWLERTKAAAHNPIMVKL